MWTPMVEVVPPGECQNAKVDHVVVRKHDAQLAAMRGERLREGALTRLFVDGYLMMSDGDNEKATNCEVVHRANGDVFIAGLGIGLVLVPMLKKPEVRTVTVLEKHLGVQVLIAPHIRAHVPEAGIKLTVIGADVFDWEIPKGQKWDCIYFDIWPDICTDNLKEITKLKRRYARHFNRANPKAWMGAWEEDRLRYQKRREDREYRSNYGFAMRCGGITHG